MVADDDVLLRNRSASNAAKVSGLSARRCRLIGCLRILLVELPIVVFLVLTPRNVEREEEEVTPVREAAASIALRFDAALRRRSLRRSGVKDALVDDFVFLFPFGLTFAFAFPFGSRFAFTFPFFFALSDGDSLAGEREGLEDGAGFNVERPSDTTGERDAGCNDADFRGDVEPNAFAGERAGLSDETGFNVAFASDAAVNDDDGCSNEGDPNGWAGEQAGGGEGAGFNVERTGGAACEDDDANDGNNDGEDDGEGEGEGVSSHDDSYDLSPTGRSMGSGYNVAVVRKAP